MVIMIGDNKSVKANSRCGCCTVFEDILKRTIKKNKKKKLQHIENDDMFHREFSVKTFNILPIHCMAYSIDAPGVNSPFLPNISNKVFAMFFLLFFLIKHHK